MLKRPVKYFRFWPESNPRIIQIYVISCFKDILGKVQYLENHIMKGNRDFSGQCHLDKLCLQWLRLRKKRPYLEFFWAIISCIWTVYGYLQSRSPYSVQKLKIRTEKLWIRTFFTQCTWLYQILSLEYRIYYKIFHKEVSSVN